MCDTMEKLKGLIISFSFLAIVLLLDIGLVSPYSSITKDLDKLTHFFINLESDLAEDYKSIENIDEWKKQNHILQNSQIHITKYDSLQWWQSLDLPFTLNQYLFHSISFESDKQEQIRISIPIIENATGQLVSSLYQNPALSLSHNWQIAKTKGKISLPLEGKTIELSPVGKKYSLFKSIGLYLGYILSLIFILISLTKITHNQIPSELKWLGFLAIGFMSAVAGIIPMFKRDVFHEIQKVDAIGNFLPASFFISALGMLCLASLFYRFHNEIFQRIEHWNKSLAKAFYPLAFSVLFGYFAAWIKVQMPQTISLISLDQIFFTSHQGLLLFTSQVLALISIFLVQLVLYKRLYQLAPKFNERIKYILPATLAMIPIALGTHIPIIPAIIGLIAYTLFFDIFSETQKQSITWSIFWLIILGVFHSSIFFYHTTKQEEKINYKRLKLVNHSIDDDLFLQLQTLKPKLDAIDFQTLTTIPYPSKIAAFDIRQFFKDEMEYISNETGITNNKFYLFNNFSESLIEESAQSINQFLYRKRWFTEMDNGILFDPFYNKYLIKYVLKNDMHPGTPFELYIEFSNPDDHKIPEQFTYAYYENHSLVHHFGGEYPNQFNSKNPANKPFIENGLKYYTHQINDKVQVVSIQKVASLIKPVSLFSFAFLLMGITTLCLLLFNSQFRFLNSDFRFSFFTKSLKTKLQTVFILLIIFSFVFIGIVTLLYFSKVNQSNEKEKLLTSLDYVGKTIADHLSIDFSQINAAQVHRELENIIDDKKSRVILYKKNGDLIFNSSDPSTSAFPLKLPLKYLLQKDKIFTPEINSWNGDEYMVGTKKLIKSNGDTFFIQLVSYSPNETIGAVNDFIGSLLNVYVFLFLIASAIAIGLSNSITNPITTLGEKLSQIKLGHKNESLDYTVNDEIGTLIQEYNSMLLKLEESAEFIAQTERDLAWREMAKQVAHEIKNPLTPMKLRIQYLQNAVRRADVDKDALVNKVAHTLLEQIENLSQIANEFSNFAKLPQGQNEKVILNEVVEAIHDLFRKRDDMDVVLEEPIDDITVFADKNHLIRVLNNLVKNAIQAIPQDRRGNIKLTLYKEDLHAMIKVSDNGMGIPEHMKHKIFTPNFTTKNSGSGLGLAISANMLDSFNAKIFFESQEHIGTDFFIQIPLMRENERLLEEHRIFLT